MTARTVPEDPPDAPAGGPRPLKKARLVEERIAAVADELFQTPGYAMVTMAQIAAVAEVSKRTLYKYLPVREAVRALVLEGQLAQDLAGLGFRFDPNAPFRDNVTALLKASATWCKRGRC